MRLSLDAPILDRSPAAARSLTRPGTLAQALQGDLIARLARAHCPVPMHITAPAVDAFTADLLDSGDRAMQSRLEVLRQRGFSNEDPCLDLLAPAARKLGALWDDDRCDLASVTIGDFTSVTVGVGQSQRLMRLFGPDSTATAATATTAPTESTHAAGLHLLLVRAPHEQHIFGLTMVAEFFRSAGWGVRGVSGTGGGVEAAAEERAQVQHFDAVGFSDSGETQLGWVAALIKALRRASRNPDVVVMLGGPLFVLQPQRAAELGGDLCLPAARQAPALAQQRVQQGEQARLRALQAV